jgi:hypothetical protein
LLCGKSRRSAGIHGIDLIFAAVIASEGGYQRDDACNDKQADKDPKEEIPRHAGLWFHGFKHKFSFVFSKESVRS